MAMEVQQVAVQGGEVEVGIGLVRAGHWWRDAEGKIHVGMIPCVLVCGEDVPAEQIDETKGYLDHEALQPDGWVPAGFTTTRTLSGCNDRFEMGYVLFVDDEAPLVEVPHTLKDADCVDGQPVMTQDYRTDGHAVQKIQFEKIEAVMGWTGPEADV